jgi:hypothetical protein
MKILFFLLFIVNIMQAQQTSLSVFYIKGTPKIKHIREKKWENIQLESILLDSDSLLINANSSLILIDKQGLSNTLINGKYAINNILKNFKEPQSQSSIANEYFSYIWEKLTEDHAEMDVYAKKYMRSKGIVSKGNSSDILMIQPLYGESIKTDNIEFEWKKDASNYTFEIYNESENGKLIFSKDLAENKLKLSINAIQLQKGKKYYWTVFPKGDTRGMRFLFTCKKNEQLAEFNKIQEVLFKNFNFDEGFKAFIYGSLYEKNNFLSDAKISYEKAIKIEPKNKLFLETYQLFKARNILNY